LDGVMDATAAVAENDDAAEGPWALPDGWCWTRTDAVAIVNPSTNFDTLDPGSEIPFIPMAAVAEETGKIDLSARRPIREVAKGYVRFMEGDVIFAKITPCMENGKVAPVVGLVGEYAAGSTEFHVFRPTATDQRYLWYWLVGRSFRGRAKRTMSGSAGHLRVPVDWLREADFPLAPLAEQRRIVAMVDALFAEVAEGESAVAEARKGLSAFRRALLKAAVTGELTEGWRAENLVTETGHDLLARIAKITKEVSGKALPKSRRHLSNDASPLDAAAFPRLPNGWAWATVRDVGTVQLGRQRAPQHHTGEHMRPYLRVANVFEDRIDFADVKEMNFTPDEFKTYELRPGDILLNEGQTPDLLGRPAMWRGEFEGYCFQNTLLRFQVRAPMNAEFCLLVFRHYLHAKRFKQESQITTNIAHLSSGRFGVIEFPVPPLEEQAEIVRRVLEGLASASDTLTMLDAEAADAHRLKQSVLKAAFEGRLVPQDPADEPASTLLARPASDPPAIRAKRGQGRKSNA
jgi:type I restriction enzyme S subunit